MRIGFVGAGKVGVTLAKYMSERNVCVSGFYSQSITSAKEASIFTHTKYYETLGELVMSSDALFLTVPDGAIETVWNSLKNYAITDKLICHCSGAMSSAVFSEIDQMGAFGYSIHPLFAIHSKLHSYQEISQSYFTIEGHEKYLEYWKDLFESFGNPVRIIDRDQKTKYHAAAVYVSNFVCSLYETSIQLLAECGFERHEAQAAVRPLFLNNANAVAKEGPAAALTGPLERADAGTIRHHMEILNECEREKYALLSETLLQVAKRKNPKRDYSEVSDLLERNGMKHEKHNYNL